MKMKRLAILAALALPAAAQESPFTQYLEALPGLSRPPAVQGGTRAGSAAGSRSAWSGYYENRSSYSGNWSRSYDGLLRGYGEGVRSASEAGLRCRSLPEPAWKTPAALPRAGAGRRTLVVPVIPRHGVSGSSTRIGPFVYHQLDGVSGTTTKIGDFYYHDFNTGLSGTSTEISGFVYHDFNNGVSGTSTKVGGFVYPDFNNGLSGTSTRIGGFTYHDFNNGVSCVSSAIGSTVYTDCY